MRYFLVLFFSILLFSCSQDKTLSIPDSVLSEDKMAEVMVDIHLLEASLNISILSKDKVSKDNVNPTTDILKRHHITKQQYDESFSFYSHNPMLLSEMYLKVLNELSRMQAQVTNSKE